MTAVQTEVEFIRDAPISTWFRVGGTADRLARPTSVEEVARCVRAERRVRVLGDGANLLVADRGVDGLVLDLERMNTVTIDAKSGFVRAEAGADLFRLINQTTRAGLAGLEVLAGIPASVGGAVMMNAGGRFGNIAETIRAVEVVRPDGTSERIERPSIAFEYRTSGIRGVIVSAEFQLTPQDPGAVRDRLKQCMAYKKASQPLNADSAGGCFKNPVLREAIEGIGRTGERVSAGLLLDRAGCKGMRSGGAAVSREHANFLITSPGSTATDLIALMNLAAQRVFDAFGVRLEREVVIWDREDAP